MAAVHYITQYHGLSLGIQISTEEFKLMTDSILVSSPREINVNFDLLWDDWKLKNKTVKIDELEFKLKNKDTGLVVIVGHKARVTVEEELTPTEFVGMSGAG